MTVLMGKWIVTPPAPMTKASKAALSLNTHAPVLCMAVEKEKRRDEKEERSRLMKKR